MAVMINKKKWVAERSRSSHFLRFGYAQRPKTKSLFQISQIT